MNIRINYYYNGSVIYESVYTYECNFLLPNVGEFIIIDDKKFVVDKKILDVNSNTMKIYLSCSSD